MTFGKTVYKWKISDF